jgi:acyl-CoA synthetase (AMP-forming)/AMP-acid ligase II
LSGLAPLQHIILWKQTMHREVTDIYRRWILARDGKNLAGLLFYRFGAGLASGTTGDIKGALYIHELQTAWSRRNDEVLFTMLMDKFKLDREVAACDTCYICDRVKNEENSEILASVGFKENYPDGWKPLGSAADTVSALKLRYMRPAPGVV